MRRLNWLLMLGLTGCAVFWVSVGHGLAQAARDDQFSRLPPPHVVREVDDPDAVCRAAKVSTPGWRRVISCTYASPLDPGKRITVLPNAYAWWRAHPTDTYARIKACEDQWQNGRPMGEDGEAAICRLP